MKYLSDVSPWIQIANKSPPNYGFQCSGARYFQLGHEKIGIRRGHSCTHGCTMDLEIMLITKYKIILFKNVGNEGGNDLCRWIVSISSGQRLCTGRSALSMWDISSLGSRPSLQTFTLRADCAWAENIEKSGKAWAQTSREVDVRWTPGGVALCVSGCYRRPRVATLACAVCSRVGNTCIVR